MKNKIALFLAVIILCLLFSGCASHKDSGDAYMDYALDAHGYCLFANRELTAILNQLSTQMLMAQEVKDGYDAISTKAGAKESLTAIQEAHERIYAMPAPDEYRTNRENTLRIIELVEQDMQSFIDVLDAPNIERLDEISKSMQSNFIALTAEFNIYYK